MKKLVALAVFIGLFTFISSGWATPVELMSNGDFETGNLDNWNTAGDVQVAQAGLISELQGMSGSFALLGLGTSSGLSSLSQAINVSGISQLTVSFNWAFDYLDLSRNASDTFISFIAGDGANPISITMQDLYTNSILSMNSGYYTGVFDISQYTSTQADIWFNLMESSSSLTYSIAGIDNVSVLGEPVPEPGTVLLLGVGLFGIGFFGRRFIRV